jgi:aspartate aminotransferase/aminotransferase
MTGWRVGWAIAPSRIAGALGLVVAAQVNNLPLFAQRAAEAALTGPQACVGAMVATYRRRRDLAVGILRERGVLEYEPHGAFYLLVPAARVAAIPEGAAFDDVRFAERLIESEHVAVGPGSSYGPAAARHVRVSLASADDAIRDGLDRLLRFSASYRA